MLDPIMPLDREKLEEALEAHDLFSQILGHCVLVFFAARTRERQAEILEVIQNEIAVVDMALSCLRTAPAGLIPDLLNAVQGSLRNIAEHFLTEAAAIQAEGATKH